jgi:hypothetical protein
MSQFHVRARAGECVPGTHRIAVVCSHVVEYLTDLAVGATVPAGTLTKAAHKRGGQERCFNVLGACAHACQAVRTSLLRSLLRNGEPVVVFCSQSACVGRHTPELLLRQALMQERCDASQSGVASTRLRVSYGNQGSSTAGQTQEKEVSGYSLGQAHCAVVREEQCSTHEGWPRDHPPQHYSHSTWRPPTGCRGYQRVAQAASMVEPGALHSEVRLPLAARAAAASRLPSHTPALLRSAVSLASDATLHTLCTD